MTAVACRQLLTASCSSHRRALSSSGGSALIELEDLSLEEVADHVHLVTLNRPTRGNAFSLAMAESLEKVPSLLPASCRAIVVTGRGEKAFCTGRDLVESRGHTQAQATRYLEAMVAGVLGIKQLSIPSVAAINGAAFGGGLELALACDLRVADTQATLCFPECSLGLFPGAAGCVLVTRLVGAARAKDLLFTSRRFTYADKCLSASLYLQPAQQVGVL